MQAMQCIITTNYLRSPYKRRCTHRVWRTTFAHGKLPHTRRHGTSGAAVRLPRHALYFSEVEQTGSIGSSAESRRK